MTNYLYHRVHPDMQGQTLYPLNRLKDKYPKVYETRKEKYLGREYLLNLKIETLECLWNDVLFLSPVHPKKIKKALIEAGRKKDFNEKYYQIDTNDLDIEKIAIYSYPKKVKNFSLSSKDFIDYSPEEIARHNFVPEATKQYYEESYNNGERPLPYVGIPHILYKDTIDVSNVPIVSA